MSALSNNIPRVLVGARVTDVGWLGVQVSGGAGVSYGRFWHCFWHWFLHCLALLIAPLLP